MTPPAVETSAPSSRHPVEAFRWVTRRLRWLPWLIPVAVLVSSLWSWHETRRQHEAAVRTAFDFETEQMCDEIMVRLREFGMVLRGGRGLFDASSAVSRDDFGVFATSMDPQVSEPGMQALGFALMLPEAEIPAHEAAVRAEGLPDYAVHPRAPRELYSSILYLERFDWRNQRTYGFDMFSDATKAQAMLRARDTAVLAASGRTTVLQETREGDHAGFVLYLPVYRTQSIPLTVAERRRALMGFVYGVIRMDDFIHQAWGDNGEIALRITDTYDAANEREMFRSEAPELDATEAAKPFATRSLTVNAFGHPWELTFTSRPVFDEKMGDHEADLLLIGGGIDCPAELGGAGLAAVGAAAGQGGAGRDGGGPVRKPGQERVSGRDEPRTADTAERGHRDGGTASWYGLECAAAAFCRRLLCQREDAAQPGG